MDTSKSVIVLALPLAIALVASNLGCSPEVPAMPTYTNDVRPILMAHCVRCHGAGGTLNTNPDVTSVNLPAPRQCYLQRFEDEGDCTDRNNLTACRSGAGYCGTLNGTVSLITERVLSSPATGLIMPPPPAEPLNDWEKEVLTRWSTASPAQ